MRSIAAKYDDSGVTDAITKYNAYVSSKTFTPSDITKWVSTIEHAWVGWRNTVTDPDHMAAVELVRKIHSSDNEDGKTWAFSFTNTQGDKPYTVADLLEKVVSQDKLLNAGGTKKKATALLAGHGISCPKFKRTKNNKQGKQKKRYASSVTARSRYCWHRLTAASVSSRVIMCFWSMSVVRCSSAFFQPSLSLPTLFFQTWCQSRRKSCDDVGLPLLC